MRKVIFDCDNTMGVEGCDVDDGLAMLYLFGRPDVEVLGVTSVYGNSDVNTVHTNTVTMLRELGKSDIPVTKGCASPSDLGGKAAEYIVDTVSSNDNVSILATGPLTNLYAAYRLDSTVLDRVKEIVLMGGLTEPLIINGRELNELNFSCDPIATDRVLRNSRNLSVITGNACLDAFFPQATFQKRLGGSKRPLARYILDKCGYWFEGMRRTFDIGGFYNWDVVAAVRLAEPSLFKDVFHSFRPSMEGLERGFLTDTPDDSIRPCRINIPRISDIKAFSDEVYRAWLR